MKMIWLRDYDLARMKQNINAALTEGRDPDDCVVKIEEVEKAIQKVFDDIKDLCDEQGWGIYKLKPYIELTKRHLSTFVEQKRHNNSSKKDCSTCYYDYYPNNGTLHGAKYQGEQ